jgi:hypothetical protein
MAANCVPSKKPEYGLIILGNAGAGKSYICNMIIGYERFETDFRREAVTTTAEYHRINAGPSDLLVYNIPGLIESHQEEIDRNKREIIKAFERCPISVVMFVWTQVDGRPQPDDIIAFKALKEAYKFSSKSLIFVLNNIPSKRPPTYEGRFLALLTKMLNPMPISLEDMFFLNTLNSEDNEKFDGTRDRLLFFIAQHRENEQRMQADIIVLYNEVRMIRKAIKEQYVEAEKNKQTFELQINQMAKKYEAVRKDQEKRYQDMMFKLEVAKQQAAEEEKGHEFAGVELETVHKENKTGMKQQCQQLWKKVEDERGIFKKVEKGYQIARNELCDKYKSNKNDEKKKPAKVCNNNSDFTLLRPAAIGVGLGAASGGVLGAAAGAVVGGAAGIILGPCAIATAAAGAVAGAAAGVTIGGISGAIATLYKCRKKCL